MKLRFTSSRRLALFAAVAAMLAGPVYAGTAHAATPPPVGVWSYAPHSLVASTTPTDLMFKYVAKAPITDGHIGLVIPTGLIVGGPHVNFTCSPDVIVTQYDVVSVEVTLLGVDCAKDQYFTATMSASSTSAGVYTVTGTGADDVVTSMPVTVKPAAPATITTMTPASDFVAGTVMTPPMQFQVTDLFGNLIDGPGMTVFGAPLTGTLTERVTHGVATFDNLKGTKAGTYTATVKVGALIGPSVTFSILPGAVDHLVLSPAESVVVAGTPLVSYTAAGYDRWNNFVADETAGSTFTMVGGSCTDADCTPSTTVGKYLVTATYAGPPLVTGSTHLTVTRGPLDHIVLSPGEVTTPVGTTKAFTAKAHDAYGNAWNVTPDTTFTVDPPATCTVNKCGSTTAGPYTVTGTYGSVTDTATLYVNNMQVKPNGGALPFSSQLAASNPAADWFDLLNFGDGSDVTAPAGPTTTVSASRWMWDNNLLDPADTPVADQKRAVTDPGGNVRAACVYASDQFTVTLHFTDAYTGTLYLYAVDWDQVARAENVQVTDGLGTQFAHLAGFPTGTWVGAPITVPSGGGDVTITVTNTAPAPANAVLSALVTVPTI